MLHLDEKTWDAVTSHADTRLEPPAALAAMVAVEAAHRVELPPSHREFLLHSNGGEVGYARLFGVGRLDHLDLDGVISETLPFLKGIAGGPVLPFANDWGGSYFCYNLRRRSADGEF